MRRSNQCGVTTVEFAIVGLVLVVILFALIEFGRIILAYNVLQEGARRGARVAAVCPVGHASIANVAVLLPLPGLTPSNVLVEYLDQSGAALGDPGGANYSRIHFVRVTIVDYSFEIFVPLLAPSIDAPEFSSTLPRESLGVPHAGAPAAC